MANVKSSRRRAAHSTRSRLKTLHPGDAPPLQAEEVLELLSRRLALVETCSVALRTTDDDPKVGSISQALAQSAALLGEAHEIAGLYMQGVRP